MFLFVYLAIVKIFRLLEMALKEKNDWTGIRCHNANQLEGDASFYATFSFSWLDG
jgi:hypothetical protein